jgi:stage II sporulation protein AB (anti-sigma F factor)
VQRCEQSWPARAEHVGSARRAASVAAGEAGAEAHVLYSVRLAVSEAVSNVVEHGYRDGHDGAFTMAIEWDLDLLSITIRDNGSGMQPRMDSPGAGLGLPLIASLVDSFSVAAPPDGGTEVCMTFPLGLLSGA